MQTFDLNDICIGTEEFRPIHETYKNSIINVTLAGITFPDNRYHICHVPDFYVFEYVCSGKGHLICNEKSHDVEAGDFYLMPRCMNCFYYADHDDPFKKKWFNISGSLISSLIDAYGLPKDDIFIKKIDVEGLFDSIHTQLSVPDNEEAAMAHLLLSLVSTVSKDKNRSAHTDIIDSVVQYIDRNVKSPIRLEDVAKQFHISRTYLIYLFKTKYGVTPYDYYLKQKIATAKELLSNFEMPIQQIAFELAFSDSHHFSTTFKKICGISPKEYRKIRGKKS